MKLKKKIAIVFLTFNSDKTIENSLRMAHKITKEILIIDSFSHDKTISICKKFKCKVIKRKFKNYSNQRNWIIKKINNKYIWQLHLDADEVLDEQAVQQINNILEIKKSKKEVFLIKRKYYFLGKKLNFPGLNEWHLRFFKSYSSSCENTLYDQHFISKKKVFKLNGYMHDDDKLNLNNWKRKHEKWARLESLGIIKNKKFTNNFKFKNDPRYFYRLIKIVYYKLPRYIRPIIYFVYRYLFRLGFLDGKIGFLFCYYQAFWFRLLIDKNLSKLND